MHWVSSIISLFFVSLTIHAGETDSSVISNPTVLQDFYRGILNQIRDDVELGSDAEQDVDAYILSHLMNQLSKARNSEPSLSPYSEDGSIMVTKEGLQKRSKSDAKRTKDMSRLAMRILKRSQGNASSRVAYRILKKRERGNAARIAMRVLRKRGGDQYDFKNFNRVTRASPYSNIGGYFGGMSLGNSHNYPMYYPTAVQELSNTEQKRSECSPNCEEAFSTQGEEDEA